MEAEVAFGDGEGRQYVSTALMAASSAFESP
jgi:hypothetical protein